VAFLAHVGGFVFGLAVLWMLTKIRGKGSTPSGGQRVYKMQW
jgi:membrane associated rhomboid family serine protease